MSRRLFPWLFVLLLAASRAAAAPGWTVDGGDSARGKFVAEGGLPEALDPSRLRVESNPELPYPVMVLHRGAQELLVYGVDPTRQVQRNPLLRRAGLGSRYLARVDATSLAVRQRVELDGVPWVGGALLHPNGDTYAVNGARVYRFPGGDLSRPIVAELPDVNGLLTLYNGLVAGADGRLLTKGWALERQDGVAGLIAERLGRAAGGAALLLGGLALALAARRGARGLGLFTRGLVGAALGVVGVGVGFSLGTGTSLVAFSRSGDPGVLLVLDPLDLKVVQRVTPQEKLSFCRLTLAPAEGGGEWLLATGTEHLFRWRYREGLLTLDEGFTERYRAAGDGSQVGTAVVAWEGAAYFNDNVSPVGLTAVRYRLYQKALSGGGSLQVTDLGEGVPGFQYWSPAIAPHQQALVVWDTHAGVVQARHLSSGQRLWKKKLYTMDGVSVAARPGHVYVGDYGRAFSLEEHLALIRMGSSPPPAHKTLVVLDAATGEERARLPIGDEHSSVMGLIVPGSHNDVYVPTRGALTRVFQE